MRKETDSVLQCLLSITIFTIQIIFQMGFNYCLRKVFHKENEIICRKSLNMREVRKMMENERKGSKGTALYLQ